MPLGSRAPATRGYPSARNSSAGCNSLLFRLLLAGAFLLALTGCAKRVSAQLATVEHLAKPGFWPTQINKSSADFVGVSVCAKCHAQIAAVQLTVPMALTVARAADSKVLHSHPHLNFAYAPYEYEITTSASGSIYSVTDGTRSLSAPLIWAFGVGPFGQSFLFQQDGRWHEARVTYFRAVDNLHFTPGRAITSPPLNLEEAMSRTVTNEDVVRCFLCHATGVTSQYKVDTSNLFLGVSCEACHGPGASHVAAMTAEIFALGGPTAEASESLIFNPARLDPPDAVDFCGSCHLTSWDVRLLGLKGLAALKSPGYRLDKSKCWGKGDARLECTACHDPHTHTERQPEAYDDKCLACHVTDSHLTPSTDHPGRACPVSTSRCTSCHMPKVEVPEVHRALTDHDIRIAHAGEPLPE